MHQVQKCKHGTVISQCRCPAPDKAVTILPCPEWCPEYNPDEEEAE